MIPWCRAIGLMLIDPVLQLSGLRAIGLMLIDPVLQLSDPVLQLSDPVLQLSAEGELILCY
ncbi:hypothetical protein L9F63_017493, partial [Diploptera punctata]